MTQIDFGNCCQGATKVLLQSNGKIITVGGSNGESSEDDFLLARLTPTGSLDPDLWRWRQSTNFLWRSKWRSQRRRFSARWEDCGCRFPSDRPRAVR
jgi:hypothetical protein